VAGAGARVVGAALGVVTMTSGVAVVVRGAIVTASGVVVTTSGVAVIGGANVVVVGCVVVAAGEVEAPPLHPATRSAPAAAIATARCRIVTLPPVCQFRMMLGDGVVTVWPRANARRAHRLSCTWLAAAMAARRSAFAVQPRRALGWRAVVSGRSTYFRDRARVAASGGVDGGHGGYSLNICSPRVLLHRIKHTGTWTERHNPDRSIDYVSPTGHRYHSRTTGYLPPARHQF